MVEQLNRVWGMDEQMNLIIMLLGKLCPLKNIGWVGKLNVWGMDEQMNLIIMLLEKLCP